MEKNKMRWLVKEIPHYSSGFRNWLLKKFSYFNLEIPHFSTGLALPKWLREGDAGGSIRNDNPLPLKPLDSIVIPSPEASGRGISGFLYLILFINLVVPFPGV
jgi:hypothetical protein